MVVGNVNRFSLWRVRWFRALFGLDILGLALATYLASRSVPFPKGQMLVAMSITLGMTYWFAFQPRALVLPFSRYFQALLCPFLAASSTLVVQAALRDYYSGMYLAKFTAMWMVVMIIVRVTLVMLQPPARVLMVRSSPYWADIREHPRLRATVLDQPPSEFGQWDVVALDPTATYDRAWLSWLTHADLRGVPVVSAPTLIENLTGRIAVEALEGRWATEVFHGPTDYRTWKRILDVLSVLVLAPVLLPAITVVALLVLVTMGRPVLYWQTRVGIRGQPFRMVKFRTMHTQREGTEDRFAARDDVRITKIGAVLRKYRLDELPQFWNVLAGRMSVIGPRPEQTQFASDFERTIPLYHLRHSVKPGITGWAQVSHGYAASREETQEKLRYDMYYVKHVSFWLDLEVAARTLLTIATGFGSR